jgi:cyclase
MFRKVACALALGLAASFAYAQEDYSKVEIKVVKVAGSVYMLQGADAGNIGASVGEDGIVIVDDQYAPLADKIRAALKGVTDKPIRFVINTHYHGDHTGGNALFQKDAPIIAHDNVRKRLQDGVAAGNLGSVKFDEKPQPKDALPILTFDHDMTVHLNGEDIRALHFPSGHTDGDSIIFFPKSNVVHMGDDFVRYGFPFIDLGAGGSVDGMIAAMEEVVPRLPPDVKVIPGHGDLANLDDVREFVKMLKETRAVVQSGIKQHKTLAQLQQAKVLEPWKKWSNDFITSDAFIETLYNDLSGARPGGFMKHN